MSSQSSELFDTPAESEPLAARMRPRTLDELIGQDHILGPGRLLRRAIAADQLSSLIFSGPPGSGKTTIARIIANTTRSRFAALNAVLTGVTELRKEIQTADDERRLYGRRTILFIDEVHRWNKAQQDALLPWVENGTVVLIGATTENPFFEVNAALVSRSRIFQLTRLNDEELRRVCRQALADRERGYGMYDVRIDPEALEHIVHVADGDARSLLNALELAVETTPERFPPPPGEQIHVTLEIAEESIQRKALLYDRDGDYHYDTISAFIKSLRGSDPDAALYWLARMIRAGEDPKFLFRRMLISASEDIGLADPQALPHTAAAAEAFDRVGMPEGAFHLAQAALYLATTEKSNATLGYFDAVQAVESERSHEVPSHLRDAHRDSAGFGHGKGYLYPHAYREHWVAQNYLPAGLQGRVFYRPSECGYEGTLRTLIERRREAQLAATFAADSDELLTYSPLSPQRDHWIKRAAGEASQRVSERRAALFDAISIPRHLRVLVLGETPSAFVWEAARAAPEGLVFAVISDSQEYHTALGYSEQFAELDRPQLVRTADEALASVPSGFELGLGLNVLLREPDKAAARDRVASTLIDGGRLALIEDLPAHSTRLSTILARYGLQNELVERLSAAEDELYADTSDPRMGNSPEALEELFSTAQTSLLESRVIEFKSERLVTRELLERWLPGVQESPGSTTQSGYAAAAVRHLNADQYRAARAFAHRHLADATVEWSTSALLILAQLHPGFT